MFFSWKKSSFFLKIFSILVFIIFICCVRKINNKTKNDKIEHILMKNKNKIYLETWKDRRSWHHKSGIECLSIRGKYGNLRAFRRQVPLIRLSKVQCQLKIKMHSFVGGKKDWPIYCVILSLLKLRGEWFLIWLYSCS